MRLLLQSKRLKPVGQEDMVVEVDLVVDMAAVDMVDEDMNMDVDMGVATTVVDHMVGGQTHGTHTHRHHHGRGQ